MLTLPDSEQIGLCRRVMGLLQDELFPSRLWKSFGVAAGRCSPVLAAGAHPELGAMGQRCRGSKAELWGQRGSCWGAALGAMQAGWKAHTGFPCAAQTPSRGGHGWEAEGAGTGHGGELPAQRGANPNKRMGAHSAWLPPSARCFIGSPRIDLLLLIAERLRAPGGEERSVRWGSRSCCSLSPIII